MGMNITEKILARASGKTACAPGDIVEAAIDVAMLHDIGTQPHIASSCFSMHHVPWQAKLGLLYVGRSKAMSYPNKSDIYGYILDDSIRELRVGC